MYMYFIMYNSELLSYLFSIWIKGINMKAILKETEERKPLKRHSLNNKT